MRLSSRLSDKSKNNDEIELFTETKKALDAIGFSNGGEDE